jgi:hypothetical protein
MRFASSMKSGFRAGFRHSGLSWVSRFFPVIVLVPKSAVEDEAQKKPSPNKSVTELGIASRKLMLKIRRTVNGEVGFMVSGRMDSENIAELERPFRSEANRHMILDLKDLTLANQDGINYLERCEAGESRSRIAQHTSASRSRDNQARVSA